MTRHYSPKDFFRQMPKKLLERFFAADGVLADFDFPAMKDGKTDALFAAWLALPDAERKPIDAVFSDIFDMSCEKGFKAILTETPHQFKDQPEKIPEFVDMLSALPNHFERAMTTYLDYPNFWKAANRFYHADTLSSHWRKRKNLPHKLAAVDAASIARLEAAIGGYFHYKEGRGKNCAVEPYRRGALDYYFAFPEDYSQQEPEWVNGVFTPRPHTPAFMVIFIYSQQDGSLDIHYQGSHKAIQPLQTMFAVIMLGLDELPPDPKDERVYELGPLLQKNFDFAPAVGSGIENVVVKKLRLSSRVKKGERITLEADTSLDPKAIYTLIDKIGKSTPLHLYNVTLVELSASVVMDDKPPRNVAIRITHPNSCSLKYDELDHKLRDMLADAGIELKELAEDAQAPVATEPVEA
ncbi:MAG: hypothetical protein Q8O38_13100 [Sulfurimicrobium sp.]|nr:hypothetical protein [Sulfurimicrobium sp.]